MIRSTLTGISFFCFSAVYASDPVSWSMSPSDGFPITKVGEQTRLIYTFTNHLPGKVLIQDDLDVSGGNFHVINLCRNHPINPKATCRMIVSFNPKQSGEHRLRLSYQYNNNVIPLPVLITHAAEEPPTQDMIGSVFGIPPLFTLNPLQQPRFKITYTNRGQTSVTGYASDPTLSPNGLANVINLISTCGTSGGPVTIKPNKKCFIEGQLSPLAAGTVQFQSQFIDNNGGKITTVQVHSEIIQGSGACMIFGYVRLPLPQTTYQYTDNLVEYEFRNECATPVTLGTVQINTLFTPNQGQTATLTVSPQYDTCSNQTIAGSASCRVLASVIPQNTANNMTLTAEVNSGGITSTALTSTQVLPPPNQHVVSFRNQCRFNVWYGIANGSGGIYSPDPTPGSQTPNGAPPSAYLVPSQVDGQAPSVLNLAVPVYTNGAIWPRVNCELNNAGNLDCATGTCQTLINSGTCVVKGGTLDQPINPNTKFEFTITNTPGTDGVYDVSVINGVTVPVEIKGLGPTKNSEPFTCTGAGAPIQPSNNQLGECSWAFNPALAGLNSNHFTWVTPGADDACNGACGTQGQLCGEAFNVTPTFATNPSQINRRCGAFLGYSNLANYYGYPLAGQWGSQNLYNFYNIGTPMTTINPQASYGSIGGNPATFGALIACTPTSNNSANTCYNTQSNLPTCCGCVNWNEPSSPVITAVSKACNGINSDWTNTQNSSVTVFNAIKWLKQACPTAYSYQFDDESSSFTCTKNSAGQSMLTSYEITFCPGGLSGLPEGATDAR